MSQPGLLWVNSKITRTDILTPATFNTWYEETHIKKDILPTSGISTAFRYQNINPSADRPYLAYYPAKDVHWLGGDEFRKIPSTDKIFEAAGGACFDCVDFDTRIYEFLHKFEKEGAKAGPANLIVSAALTPAPGTDEDFDKWYMEEHYKMLAGCKGYLRTRRYKLKTAFSVKGAPKYLAIHEFDGETLPLADLEKCNNTEWAKKVMGSLADKEIYVFSFLGGWGDVEAEY